MKVSSPKQSVEEKAKDSELSEIFVAGFSHQINVDSLTGLLSPIASISEVRVIIDQRTNRAKGYGFFKTSSSNSEKFFSSKVTLDGQPLTIKPAFRKHNNDSHRVFFMASSCTSLSLNTLQHILKLYGKIEVFQAYPSQCPKSNKGFVDYQNKDSVLKLLALREVTLKEIEIKFFEHKFGQVADKITMSNHSPKSRHENMKLQPNPLPTLENALIQSQTIQNECISLIPERELQRANELVDDFKFFGVHAPAKGLMKNILFISERYLDYRHEDSKNTFTHREKNLRVANFPK